jgi:hypothetical protein
MHLLGSRCRSLQDQRGTIHIPRDFVEGAQEAEPTPTCLGASGGRFWGGLILIGKTIFGRRAPYPTAAAGVAAPHSARATSSRSYTASRDSESTIGPPSVALRN